MASFMVSSEPNVWRLAYRQQKRARLNARPLWPDNRGQIHHGCLLEPEKDPDLWAFASAKIPMSSLALAGWALPHIGYRGFDRESWRSAPAGARVRA